MLLSLALVDSETQPFDVMMAPAPEPAGNVLACETGDSQTPFEMQTLPETSGGNGRAKSPSPRPVLLQHFSDHVAFIYVCVVLLTEPFKLLKFSFSQVLTRCAQLEMKNQLKEAKKAENETKKNRPPAKQQAGKKCGKAEKNDYTLEGMIESGQQPAEGAALKLMESASGSSDLPVKRVLFPDMEKPARPIATAARARGRGAGRGRGRGRGRSRVPSEDMEDEHSPNVELDDSMIDSDEDKSFSNAGKAKSKPKSKAKAKPTARAKSGGQKRKINPADGAPHEFTEAELAMHRDLYDRGVEKKALDLATGAKNLTFQALKDHLKMNKGDYLQKVQLTIYWTRCNVGIKLLNHPEQPQIVTIQYKTKEDFDWNYSLLCAYMAAYQLAAWFALITLK